MLPKKVLSGFDRGTIVAIFLYSVFGILLGTTFIDAFSKFELISHIFQAAALAYLLVADVVNFVSGRIRITWVLLLLIVCGCGNYVSTSHTFFLVLSLFFAAFAVLPYQRVLKWYSWCMFVTLCFVIVCSLAGVIPNLVDQSVSVGTRYLLGFQTATLPLSILLFATLSYFVGNCGKLPWWYWLGDVAATLLLFYATKTRTGMLLNLLLLFLAFFSGPLSKGFYRHATSKWLRFLTYASPFIVLLFLAVAFELFWTQPEGIGGSLNRLLSQRLNFSTNMFRSNPPSFFGNLTNKFNAEGVYIGVDICYLYYLSEYGILAFIMTLVLQLMLFHEALVTRDHAVWLAMLLILIDGITEPYLLDYKYNLIFFLASLSMLPSSTRKRVEFTLRVHQAMTVFKKVAIILPKEQAAFAPFINIKVSAIENAFQKPSK